MSFSRYAVLIVLLLVASSAAANSLWTAESKSMFTDIKATKVGDVVTVLVVESSSSSQKASSDFDKGLKHSNQAGVGPILELLPSLSLNSSQKGSSKGSTSSSTTFVAKITAKVTKVLENGNLAIEGTRSVETNGEKQDLTLTAVIRPEDIAPDNTVLSTYLADAQIKCTGKGPIGDRQKEGIISKLIKFIF